MHDINIIEWNKKRKLQGFQLDMLRPKHKCRVESFSSEDTSMSDESPIFGSANSHTVNSRMDIAFLDDRSEPESAKDSNSFIEDSDTSMSINEEAKLEADSANTYSSYDDLDTQAFGNPEERLQVYAEYVKDSSDDQSIDKEFEDFLFSNGVNPDKYVLSSGRLLLNEGMHYSVPITLLIYEKDRFIPDTLRLTFDNVLNAEAESSTKPPPPTIDQEFEEYFSALML